MIDLCPLAGTLRYVSKTHERLAVTGANRVTSLLLYAVKHLLRVSQHFLNIGGSPKGLLPEYT